MVQNAGVHLYMNSYLLDCILEQNRVTSVIMINKSGLQAISGRYFIDATAMAT